MDVYINLRVLHGLGMHLTDAQFSPGNIMQGNLGCGGF